MAKKSKQFEQYDDNKIINSRASKRTYAVRALVNTMRMSDENAVNDAEDMEFRDYSVEASSYVEAMGKFMGDMVQNYAFNMCVKYFQTFVEFFEELGHMDTDKVKDMLSSENLSEEEVERLKSIYQDKWQEVPVPVEYCLKVLGKILEDFKDEDNLLMWQEPEMIVMGNPNLLGAMNVRAETVGDYAEDGIKDLAKFMVDFGTKSSSEEE